MPMPNKVRLFTSIACQPRVLRNSTRIALFVGTVLNLINQGANLFGDGTVSWPHVLLNYTVPFCVATYSATLNEMARRGDRAMGT